MTFSSVKEGMSDLIKNMYRQTDEVCETHNINLVNYKGGHSFCLECARENLEKSENELLESETEKAYSSDKRWLKNRSITVDRDILNSTFKEFDEMDEETTANKEKALKIARSYYKGNKHNTILVGKYGTGKTHLAVAILNQLNEHTNTKNMFVSLDELMAKIKAGFNQRDPELTEERAIHLLSKADLLVIDDLGAEIGSVDRASEAGDFTVRILNGILNARMNKSTIFTTNLNSKQLRKAYDGRIMSRIMRGINKDRIIKFEKTTDKRSQIEF